MKKGLKKTLAALAAGAMLLSMNMSAFAALSDYNAVTTYDGTTATVTVSNVKTGADDQVAFLAENGNEIIYIDQKTANASGEVSDFTFSIDLEDAIATPTIKVGSTSEAAGEPKSIKLASIEVNVTADAEKGEIIVDETTIYGDSFKVYVVPYNGYKVASYTVDNGDAVEAVVNNENAVTVNLEGVTASTANVVINFEEVGVTGDAVINVTSCTALAEGRGFTVIGTASNAKDFGVLLAEEEGKIAEVALNNVADYDAFTANKGVRKFAAMATGHNGAFSITVEDSVVEGAYQHLTNQTYKVAGYAAGATYAAAAEETVTFAE